MPDIEFKCPHCQQVLVAPEEMAGQEGSCEGCRKILRVPVLPPPLPPRKIEPPPLPPPPPFTLELLRSLEWKRFEELVAALVQKKGNRTEVARTGFDGGIDIKVYSGGGGKPIAIIQCKAWNSYKVGVKPVRELFGVMAAEQIGRGYFVTTGEFTNEARSFAHGKSLKLIDGVDLIAKIGKLSNSQKRDIYNLATWGDYETPSCPSCGRKLVRRVSKKGKHPGEEFWGCPGYPRCRYMMKMRSGRVSSGRDPRKSNSEGIFDAFLDCLLG